MTDIFFQETQYCEVASEYELPTGVAVYINGRTCFGKSLNDENRCAQITNAINEQNSAKETQRMHRKCKDQAHFAQIGRLEGMDARLTVSCFDMSWNGILRPSSSTVMVDISQKFLSTA